MTLDLAFLGITEADLEPITPLPPAPQRNMPRAVFDPASDTFLAAVPPFAVRMEGVRRLAVAALEAAPSVIGAAHYKGPWSTLSGALEGPASVLHSNALWLLNGDLPDVAAAEPGVSGSWVRIKPLTDAYGYEDRAQLRAPRALPPAPGDLVTVSGLGIFGWDSASTRLDDDETVFVAAGGAWVLVAAGADYVHAVMEALLDDIELLQVEVFESVAAVAAAQAAAAAAQATADATAARILRGTFLMSLTTLAATTSSSFTCSVAGAAVGDSAIVNPGNAFGTSTADQARLSFAAYVSAANTVTITIRNASAASAALTASTWTVIVIKQ